METEIENLRKQLSEAQKQNEEIRSMFINQYKKTQELEAFLKKEGLAFGLRKEEWRHIEKAVAVTLAWLRGAQAVDEGEIDFPGEDFWLGTLSYTLRTVLARDPDVKSS